MKRGGDTYRQFIPGAEFTIERNTANVPSDGKYYIVRAGKILMGFRSRKLAEQKFRELVRESGFEPKPPFVEQIDPGQESVERYAMAKDVFWAEGPRYRAKGGRGGRGGV